MGINGFISDKYKMEYIPQRLLSLEACTLACHTILSGKDKSTPFELDLGSSKLQQPDLSIFIGLALDAGIVANRTLLNFMGLKLDNHDIVNSGYTLNISKFSQPLVPVTDACRILKSNHFSEYEIKDMWIEALTVASKSIAHFTETGATISVAKLGIACYATSKLVRHYFFDAMSENQPQSIITPEIEPKSDSLWGIVHNHYDRMC
ncbi:hypothetical protein PZBJ_05945 [Pantoea endophytica]|jgi:hypothetical protein|uniref:Uncharacterized protein n=1 Tax=Pantoea endophytica TaxID=92488 RepID=A0ABX4SVN0_9GAMM|nr:hypothetical protein [Pantoea endophytica]PLR26326.1 hypothetical protein PZBJ_05945 [Pantoea endophytica]